MQGGNDGLQENHAFERCRIQCLLTAVTTYATNAIAQVVDPGVRRATADNTTPEPLPGLGSDELSFFEDGLVRFDTIEVVTGGADNAG
jgi:hypothetical protein